jgi:excisionase family DNA binding protein
MMGLSCPICFEPVRLSLTQFGDSEARAMETLLVNDREASRMLGISRSKFHLLVAEGRILRLKIGRSARYRRADILTFTDSLAADARSGNVIGSGDPRAEDTHEDRCN